MNMSTKEPSKETIAWAKKVIMMSLMIIAGIYQVNVGVV